MQKYIIFFVVIGASAFIYFSYINVVSKSMKNQGKAAPTATEKILTEQSAEIKRLNQDYRDIIDQTKRQTQEASHQFDQQAVRREQDRVMQDNHRQIEENRRQMEQLRRNLQHR